MAEADDRGSMLALVGADEAEASEIADAAGVTVANDNAPGQVVLAGDRDAARPRRGGRRRARQARDPLDVAGAFHSPSMEPAVAPFREALDDVELASPASPSSRAPPPQPFEDVRDELAPR